MSVISMPGLRSRHRAIAYEKSGRWFTAEDPFLRAKERTDAGSSAFRHPRSELIAPLPQEVEPAFNNRKLHMRLPCGREWFMQPENVYHMIERRAEAADLDIKISCRSLCVGVHPGSLRIFTVGQGLLG